MLNKTYFKGSFGRSKSFKLNWKEKRNDQKRFTFNIKYDSDL